MTSIKVLLTRKERQFIHDMAYDYCANLGHGLTMHSGERIYPYELEKLIEKMKGLSS